MAPRKINRIGEMTARLTARGIVIQIGTAPPVLLAIAEAKALGAVIAGALCSARQGAR